jgi:peroxiredoxin
VDLPVPPTSTGPIRYTVRKTLTPQLNPRVPQVLLSEGHAALCRVGVGEPLPSLGLPQLSGQTTELSALRGRQATVVLFWHPDRWMARTALVDMQRDIADQFESQDVSVVGIAVEQSPSSAQRALQKTGVRFTQLLDQTGQAFAAVGTSALPRLYVLDPQGTIVWFDIEYSEGTRRELWQTLKVLTSE